MVEPADQYRPRPAHFRCLRAYVDLLDEGAAVTYASIARRMGISREHFARMRRRYPGMEAWVGEQIAAENARYVGPVVRRLALLGRQGSLGHAELYLKVTTGTFSRPPDSAGGLVLNANAPAIINIAVPQPGDPPVSCSPKLISAGTPEAPA